LLAEEIIIAEKVPILPRKSLLPGLQFIIIAIFTNKIIREVLQQNFGFVPLYGELGE
jgi:hypothetical protein